MVTLRGAQTVEATACFAHCARTTGAGRVAVQVSLPRSIGSLGRGRARRSRRLIRRRSFGGVLADRVRGSGIGISLWTSRPARRRRGSGFEQVADADLERDAEPGEGDDRRVPVAAGLQPLVGAEREVGSPGCLLLTPSPCGPQARQVGPHAPSQLHPEGLDGSLARFVRFDARASHGER